MWGRLVVPIKTGGLCKGERNCLKYLKRRWNRREGRRHRDFKKWGVQAGSRGWCLKRGGGGLDWNPLTNYGVRSVLISILASFGFIIWCLDILLHFLTSWRFARLPPVSTDHFFSSWFQVKVSFYFVVWCISINTNGQSKENTLWNWLSTVALGGWSSPLFIWKWESTPNQH